MVALAWPCIILISSIDEEGCEAELGHGYKGHSEEEEGMVLDVRLGGLGSFPHRRYENLTGEVLKSR